jgi:hypothetical protein
MVIVKVSPLLRKWAVSRRSNLTCEGRSGARLRGAGADAGPGAVFISAIDDLES